MIDIHHPLQCATLAASSIASLILATANPGEEELFGISVNTIRELGSFGLVAVFILGVLWVIKSMAPKLIEMGQTMITSFLEELRLERVAREKSISDFREMLQSHKTDLGVKIDKSTQAIEDGNELFNKLIEQLEDRPCQIPQFRTPKQ